MELWTQLRPSDPKQTLVSLFPVCQMGTILESNKIMKETHSEAVKVRTNV